MSKNKKGFTIIEVVLVLAIAGLIFLMVFIALPALQRGQRNTQRKNDLSRIMTAITSYQSNNSNKTPFADLEPTTWKNGSSSNNSTLTNFVTRYIGDISSQFSDPDGEPYSISYAGTMTGTGDVEAFGSMSSDISKSFLNVLVVEDHAIYVATKAKCGTQEGHIANTSGKNDVALFYILEGGSITCVDNQ